MREYEMMHSQHQIRSTNAVKLIKNAYVAMASGL